MSEMDQVNRQHMGSMGLADLPLGPQPVLACHEVAGDQPTEHEPHTWEIHEIVYSCPGYQAAPTRTRPGDQVLPTGDERMPDDQSLVMADIEARRRLGIQRYGQAHRPFNGRNTMQDAYEENLDWLVYQRSLLRLREATRVDVMTVVAKVLADDGALSEAEVVNRISAKVAQRLADWATMYLVDQQGRQPT